MTNGWILASNKELIQRGILDRKVPGKLRHGEALIHFLLEVNWKSKRRCASVFA